jgi:hypothetical protein
MATNCGIAVKTDKGYGTIYVHNDGYPKHMLKTLLQHHNSEESARKIISLGDASCIYSKIDPTDGSGHSFNNPEDEVCVFYHRDRGEPWEDTCPINYDSKRELIANFSYLYVFEDGKWTGYKEGYPVREVF